MKLRYGLLVTLCAMPLSVYAEQSATAINEIPEAAVQASEPEIVTEQRIEQKADNMVEQAGFSTGSVVRSAITSSVENREPTDNLNVANTELNQLYFFTELRDMSGQTAKHRWEHEGKLMAEVEFNVKGPRWRVWSSKSFVPDLIGDWKVSVINGAGDVISEKIFIYETAAAKQAAEPEAPAMPTGFSEQH